MRKRVNFGLTGGVAQNVSKKIQSIHPFVLTLTKTFQNIRTFSPGGPCGPWSPLGPSIPAGPGLPAFPGSPGAPLSPYKLITDEFKKIAKDHMTVSALHARKEDYTRGRRTKGKEHIKKVYHWVGSRQTGKCLRLGHDLSIVRNILLYSAFLFRQ